MAGIYQIGLPMNRTRPLDGLTGGIIVAHSVDEVRKIAADLGFHMEPEWLVVQKVGVAEAIVPHGTILMTTKE